MNSMDYAIKEIEEKDSRIKELEQQLDRLSRSGVPVSALELCAKIDRLEQQLEEAEKLINKINDRDTILVYGEWCEEYLTKYKQGKE